MNLILIERSLLMVKMRNFRIDHYSIGVLGLNLATIVLGLAYFVFPGESAFWDFSGWLFLVSWLGTITLPFLVAWVVARAIINQSLARELPSKDSCRSIRQII
jgi:hypothetical protein